MDYCDFGFEIEMPVWLLALLIIVLLTIAIFTFIIELKIVKLRREEASRNKPKEDELQKLLNIVNNRLIHLSESKIKDQTLYAMRGDFNSFKCMILALMKDREEQNDVRKR